MKEDYQNPKSKLGKMPNRRLSLKLTTTIFAFFLTTAIVILNQLYLKTPWWLSYLIAINISSLFFFVIDKINAVQNKYRIPEITLLILLALGGDLGALIGIFKVRHKTQSDDFLKPAFLIIFIHLLIFLTIVYWKTKQ